MPEKRGGKALARERQPLGFVWLLKPSHTLRMKWIKVLLFIVEPHRCADRLRTPAPNEKNTTIKRFELPHYTTLLFFPKRREGSSVETRMTTHS